MPSGPKQGDAPVPRTSQAVPKAPSSQSAAGISDPAAPSTPVKGTFSTNIVQYGEQPRKNCSVAYSA